MNVWKPRRWSWDPRFPSGMQMGILSPRSAAQTVSGFGSLPWNAQPWTYRDAFERMPAPVFLPWKPYGTLPPAPPANWRAPR